jgi:tol-pal system protein YbgF
MSSLRDDNRRLSQTVGELRGDRRAQDRKLRDLEHQLDELRAKVAADGAAPVLPVEVAAPPAVRAAPDAARVVGVTEDGTEIVYEGEAVIGRSAAVTPAQDPGDEPVPAPASPGRPRVQAAQAAPAAPRAVAPGEVPIVADRIEVTRRIPPISARAAVRSKIRDHESTGERGDAAGDYRAAVDLVKAAKYGDALVALRAFIERHPRHDYADNAQYWIGEVFYAQKDYEHALSEFRKVVEVYPRGNKVPDALLKLAYCHQAMGQREKAHAVLKQVVDLYPKSEPAMLAARRLETP